MRFLIQKIDKEVRHDFSFTLLESIRYQKWLQGDDADVVLKYINCKANDGVWFFKPFHEHYVPVGSVEFVLSWMKRFGIPIPKPINVPEELFDPFFTARPIINCNHMDTEDLPHGKWFVKSATAFKGFAEVLRIDDNHSWNIPAGNYQMSEYIEIESEWRAFVYQGKLVGLQNYSGSFSTFPNVRTILHMILRYDSAPIAYTLDVGVNNHDTFIIEVHDFFSCGLYGFANHKIYPYMLYRWFHEYLNKNK
jgi:hypothetical protein